MEQVTASPIPAPKARPTTPTPTEAPMISPRFSSSSGTAVAVQGKKKSREGGREGGRENSLAGQTLSEREGSIADTEKWPIPSHVRKPLCMRTYGTQSLGRKKGLSTVHLPYHQGTHPPL